MIPAEFQEYIQNQEEQFQPILEKITRFLTEEFYELEPRLVYDVPFFYGRKRVLYLAVIENKLVRLGFCDGEKLSDLGGIFHGKKKEIAFLDFPIGSKVDFEILQNNILLALEFDQQRGKGIH